MATRGIPRQQTPKKIVPNKKYAKVVAVIDSGSSLSNHLKKLNAREGQKREGELFARMKPLTFARLLLETALLQDLNVLENQAFDSSTASTGHQRFGFTESLRIPAGTAPKACAPGHVNDVLIGKATGGDVSVAYNDPSPKSNRELQTAREGEAPYLLLDAREVEEWTAGHLVGARSYPSALRSRAAGPVASRELLAYKNKPDRFILVYDEDEREAPLLAQSMAERGVENCYLLSGGIKAIMSKGIQGIFIGTLPLSCRDMPPPPSKVPKTKPGGGTSRVPSGRSTATSMRSYSAYGLSGGNEVPRRTSVTEKVGSSGMAGLVRIPEPPVGYGYSSFDLAALRESLNNVSPTDSNVSRMSGVSVGRGRGQ